MTSPVMIPARQPRARHSANLSLASARVGTVKSDRRGKVRLLKPPLKNIGLPRSSRRIDHHVVPGGKRLNRPGLPTVRQHQFLQSCKCIDTHSPHRKP